MISEELNLVALLSLMGSSGTVVTHTPFGGKAQIQTVVGTEDTQQL